MSAVGRWMYGPWFWPPAKDVKYPPIANPYFEANCDPNVILADGSNQFCEPALIPSTPNVSVGMEAFNDTPIVNGKIYPNTTVDPKAYRYRILNGANDRFWNLSWYVADPTTGTLSEVALKPAEVAAAQTDPVVFPTPDTSISPKGPNWIQIGTEGGFLPAPVVVPAHETTWITDPTRFDVGNVDQHSLLLAPAERADVIVDFSQYAGQTLILYNDAPAAFPARVPGYDCYTGGPDLTPSGAPTTLAGYGPNTRTITRVTVGATAPAVAFDKPNTNADALGVLIAAFRHHANGTGVFESSQDPIIVGQAAYNSAYGTNFTGSGWCNSTTNPSAKCDGFARVQEQGAVPGAPDTFKFKFDTLAGPQLAIPFEPKGMHDEMNSASFDEWGRMTANMGLEAPGATPLLQNIILYPFVNPATEILDSTGMPSSLKVTKISSGTDGTQIWKITHNGVDTHPIHFHLYNVQLLNRVTWDNIIIPPEPTKIKVDGINLTYAGLIPTIQRSFLSKDVEAMQPHIRAFVERAITFTVCPDCSGTRLNDAARSSRINKINIAEACAMQISDLAEWVGGLDEPSVAPLLTALRRTLDSFVEIGLDYLSLDRPSGTLSGGESQRTKMIRHLGSSLTDITYVFDEPTIGLHPHDIARMNDLLLQLRDKGNTVLVVEHKPETIAIADHVVDLGPRAGTAGGEVVFEGTVDGLRASDTLTGQHLDDRASLKPVLRRPSGMLEVRGATGNNLQDVDVDIPLGVLAVVTGVAGSGKSSLIHGSVSGRAGTVSVDQAAIKGSRRSNPATYTGLLDPIRTAFAKANGVKPALFSANSEGACPACNGAGVIYTDLAMMAGVATTCEECEGKRFQAAVLEYQLGGKNISEVLAMPVIDAEAFFGSGEAKNPAAHKILNRLADVGLGHLTLGQPLTTLSGGERQRLKLAIHMAEKGDVYVLDEPTSGLHLADIEQLLGLLDRLVDSGKSVIVIAHHQAVMAHADWIIDLGPGAGHDGGRIVFEGIPADLVAARSTLTGQHLAAYIGTSSL